VRLAVGRRALAGAAVAALASVALRLPGIERRSLWLDEALTVSRALRSPAENVAIARHNQNPPGYPILLSPWVAAFGTSEAAVRLPSLLASTAAAGALFLFADRFLGFEAAVYASALYLSSEPQLYYAREARPYALIQLLCVASFFLFLRMLERPRWSAAIALGVVNAAAMYCHFSIAFAFVAQLAAALVLAPRGAFALYVASQAVALALFAPWLEALRSNLPEAGRFWLAAPEADSLRRVIGELAGGSASIAIALVVLVGWGGARLAEPRAGRASRPVPLDRIATLVAWAIVPIALGYAVSQRIPTFGLRYQLYASLGWFCLVALALAELPVPPAARAGLAVAVVAAAALHLDWSRSRGADWRSAAAAAVGEVTADSAIVVAPRYGCTPFAYYAAPDAFASADVEAGLGRHRVVCAGDGAAADPAALGWPERVILVAASDAPADFWSATARLEEAGYRAVAEHRARSLWVGVASVGARSRAAPLARPAGAE